MLPFIFDESALAHIEKLDELILTFRVWGVNPQGEICIEVFNRDKRNEEPFNSFECSIYQEGKVTAYMPTHNEEYIHGVEVIWLEEWSNPEYYDEQRTFNHGGFECNALNKNSDDLFFTEEEVVSNFNKQLWKDFHALIFAMASQSAGHCMNAMEKNRYSAADLHVIISAGYDGAGEHMGY